VAHADLAVTGPLVADGSAASPARARQWRIVDRLGEQTFRALLRDNHAGPPQQELAERYGISLSSVKRLRRSRR
jgi:hypothetical protein